MKNAVLIAAPLAVLLWGQPLLAQDTPEESCRAAAELAAEGDVDGALEEARWCLEGLEQMKQEQATAVFPDEVNGFTGSQINANTAMGMRIINREYSKGGNTISVTLNGGGSGGAMAGMAALAQMGMMGGGKKIRVQRRTVIDNSEGDTANYMASLNSGAMLMFESYDVDKDTVLEFIKAFPIAELDEAQ